MMTTLPDTSSQASAPVVHPHVPFPLPAHHVFGGFWIRFAALMIDQFCMVLPIAIISGVNILLILAFEHDSAIFAFFSFGVSILTMGAIAWPFVYTILFLGTKSTTPGKMLFGMRVVREDHGGKVSWAQAFGRTFTYALSSIFYIGFIVAGFDDEKRALHDHLAKTRVIRDTTKSTTAGWVIFGALVGALVLAIGIVGAIAPKTIEMIENDRDWEVQGNTN